MCVQPATRCAVSCRPRSTVERGHPVPDRGVTSGDRRDQPASLNGKSRNRTMADYTAWLIETDEGASINYFQMVDDDDWTFDHNKALHFGRKQDAEKMIAYYGWTRARAVEHMWMDDKHLIGVK